MGQDDAANWFPSGQLPLIEGRPQEVEAKRRSMYRDRIGKKVNGPLVQLLDLFPDLVSFIESSTRDEIQNETEPADLVRALGELYSEEQRISMIVSLLLLEQKENENTREFLNRFPNILNELEKEVSERVRYARISLEAREIFRAFQEKLLERLSNHIWATKEWSGVKVRVPPDDLINWITNRDWTDNEEVEYLPSVLETALTDPMMERTVHKRLTDYWRTLSDAATAYDVVDPAEDEWTIDFHNPSERDFRRHEVALDGLDDELLHAVHAFWEDRQIPKKDQLLAAGLLARFDLRKHDKEVLSWNSRSNSKEEWSSYHTRRANIMTESIEPPLLTREVLPKSGTDEKKYRLTSFGRFVRWLNNYAEGESDYSNITQNFLKDVPADLVEEALDTIDMPYSTHWISVAVKAAKTDT